MPRQQLELRAVEAGGRSTLYACPAGGLYRRYHDTGALTPVLPAVDARGVLRCGGNRRVDALVADAYAAYRAADAAAPRAPPPPHLRAALAVLARGVADVDALARDCGVARSTAWCYAARVVEHWPAAHVAARALVHPPLLAAVTEVPREGTLKALMARLEAGPLRGDSDWRCVDDRYAHLRLARLCVEAAEAAR